MSRNPTPEPGQRIRITRLADGQPSDTLQPGATGTISQVGDDVVVVDLDSGFAYFLLKGDRWELLPDATDT